MVGLMVVDPRCPECDGPVGTTASYCMHCGAEFERPAGLDGTDTDREYGQATGRRGDTAAPADAGGGGPALTTWEARLDRWLAPDGWLDNSLTVVVAVVVGLFVGPLTALVVGIPTQSGWAVLVGLVAWVGATAYLARRRTVYGAVHEGCLALGALVFLLPLGLLFLPGDPLVDRVGAVVVFEVVALFFGGPLLLVGWIAGHLREKKGGEDVPSRSDAGHRG